MAYRLGWALYWACVALGVVWLIWVGFHFFLVWNSGDSGVREMSTVLIFSAGGGIPALLAYGLGRLFRYVLSGE
jgi:hypothetical protein